MSYWYTIYGAHIQNMERLRDSSSYSSSSLKLSDRVKGGSEPEKFTTRKSAQKRCNKLFKYLEGRYRFTPYKKGSYWHIKGKYVQKRKYLRK